MVKPKYIYLVSDGNGIVATYTRPHGLTIAKDMWVEHGFSHKIGESISVYTDMAWVGTVGVFNALKPSHLIQLAKRVREHTLSLAARKIRNRLHDLFGQEASLNADGYRCAPGAHAQRNWGWTPEGKRLFEAEEVVNGICFRGE